MGYLVDAVVPRLDQLPAVAQLELLKPLAEMSQYCGELEDTEARCDRIYAALTVSGRDRRMDRRGVNFFTI